MSLIFTLCFFVVMVFGDGSTSSNSYENLNVSPSQSPAEYLEGLAKYFKALEDRNLELEKSQEKFKDFKTSYEKSHAELKEEIESLKAQVEKLKEEIPKNGGGWHRTLPLRGPPGEKGEKGERGDSEQNGKGRKKDKGKSGEKCKRGPPGPRGFSDPKLATSCSSIQQLLPTSSSQNEQRRETIYPHGNSSGNLMSLEVLCDFETDGGGWTIIQKRTSGPREEFNRSWTEYSKGFGSLDKNFWLGLENIHALTKNGDQELRIELEDFEGQKKFAQYSRFLVSDASDFYRLSIGGYYGDAGNDMIYSSNLDYEHNGMEFRTKDENPDDGGCATYYASGWWFNRCFAANLNGLYFQKGETVPYKQGIIWLSWKGGVSSLAKTEMKIRNRK